MFQRLGWIGIMLPVLALTMLLLGMTTAALQSAGLPTASIVILIVLFAVPAGEGALSFFNTVVLAVAEADAPGRLRIQGRRAGRRRAPWWSCRR